MAATPAPALAAGTAPPGDVQALVCGYSVEISPRHAAALDACRDVLAPGTEVYLNWIEGETHHRSIAAAATLRRAGLRPVPHVAARYLAGFTQLADFLARLQGEADVDRALAIAGDRERPAGPFESSLQLVTTGLFEKYGVARIGFAGYPEEHPRVPAQTLFAALVAKLDHARRAGLSPYVVTQFCFEAEPALAWIARLRREGAREKVRVGLAGPASVATLMKYALRCGVGNSVKALALRGPAIARLLTESGPDRVVHGLAAAGPELGIEGLHFFTFGGLARTADWARAALRVRG